MGYHVKVEELRCAQQNMQAQMKQWQEQLSEVQASLNGSCVSMGIKGATGDSIRSYLTQVQMPLVKALNKRWQNSI